MICWHIKKWLRIRQDNYNADRRAKRIAWEEGYAEGLEEGLAESMDVGKAELSAIVVELLRKRGIPEEEIERILKQKQP